MMSQPFLLYGNDERALRAREEVIMQERGVLRTYRFGDDDALGIDDVREIRRRADLAPGGSESQCFFLRLDHMTREAANALLKILEEPPESSVFVMRCSSLVGIPDTVQSRARLEAYWVENPNIPDVTRESEREEALSFLDSELLRRRERLHMLVERGDQKKTIERLALMRALHVSAMLAASRASTKPLLELYRMIP
ncbi:MAG: hypothetical protein AAB372_02680 [Patescibacteria group bacterium]